MDGSGGTIFIRTLGGAYIVKGSSRIAEELFATHLFSILGIPVAAARVTCHVENEWRNIKEAIKFCAVHAIETGDAPRGQRLKLKLRSQLQRAQLLVMELISGGVALDRVPPRADLPMLCSSAEGASKERLRTIGAVLAGDILINNSDRFPLPCWDNDGNAGNVLLVGEAGTRSAVAIDQAVCSMDPNGAYSKPLFEKYRGRAAKLVGQLLTAAAEGTDEAALGVLGYSGRAGFFFGGVPVLPDRTRLPAPSAAYAVA